MKKLAITVLISMVILFLAAILMIMIEFAVDLFTHPGSMDMGGWLIMPLIALIVIGVSAGIFALIQVIRKQYQRKPTYE